MSKMLKMLSQLNDARYTYILIILLLGCGLYLFFRTKFAPIRFFIESLKLVTEKTNTKGVSSFQAIMIATASRVGVGNIIGVSYALIVGGSGALFWMWITAILGSSSACVECILAQIYKIRNENNTTFVGGPAYYIHRLSGKRGLGVLFSWLLILCFSVGFNGLQAYNLSSSFEHYIEGYQGSTYQYLVGLGLSLIILLIIAKGIKGVGVISSVLVPIKAIIYIGVALYVTFSNVEKLPLIFRSIISNAFNFKAIFAGFSSSALLIGVKRGLYSNEAGMGSAPNAAASADVSHPAKQGILQIFSVFMDTLICTSTAFLILASGVSISPNNAGIYVVQQALYSQLGTFGIHFISFFILLFSFTSIFGNHCYSESNILYIFETNEILKFFRPLCIVPVFLGTIVKSEVAWNIADICMGLMAIMNIIFILKGSTQAINCLNNYSKLKRQNKNLKFIAESIGIQNTIWK